MDRSKFTSSAPGTLVNIPEGTVAFIPAPLPKRLDLDVESGMRLVQAIHALGRLTGFGETSPGAHLLIGPFLRREALLSSRIEGSLSTMQQLVLYEANSGGEPPTPDTREVSNYVAALQYGHEQLKETGLSLWLIRELHQILMREATSDEPNPGSFRTRQNAVGVKGQPLSEARFVPAPAHEVPRLMEDLAGYISAVSYDHFLPQLAMIHYQFETIHPFMDGNGRVGRLLITLLLCKAGLLPYPLFYLSGYLDRHRQEYVNHLLRVSETGEWKGWVDFFLDAVIAQANDAIRRSQRLLELQREYHTRVSDVRSSVMLVHLIDSLFEWPATTSRRARERLDVTAPTARDSISKLVDAGILVEWTGRQRYRVYLAPEIIDIVEAPEAEAEGPTEEQSA